jgi:hypothetical protein
MVSGRLVSSIWTTIISMKKFMSMNTAGVSGYDYRIRLQIMFAASGMAIRPMFNTR